jgi:hypothetical protein
MYMVKSVEGKSENKGRKGRRKNVDLDPSGVNVDMTMDAGDAEIYVVLTGSRIAV